MSACTPKYSCAPPGARPEADEHLVEDQDDAALGADRAQAPQPVGVGLRGRNAPRAAVDQRPVRGRVGVGMQRLQRVDQHAGDVAARAQHAQRVLDMSFSV